MVAEDRNMDSAIEMLEPYQREPGYSIMAADTGGSTLTVWWVGEVPADLQEAAANDAYGIDVQIREAAYTYDELDAAATRVLDYALRNKIPASAVDLRPDGSGLNAIVAPKAEDPHRGRELRQVANMPVSITYRDVNFVERDTAE